MNIFVCIKQVPSTSKVQVDEKTGVLKRDGVASKMNPYDLYALETALRLREEHGGRVTVGTMGPPQAEAVVREAYMMGADEGYVFSDRRLGGADVLATLVFGADAYGVVEIEGSGATNANTIVKPAARPWRFTPSSICVKEVVLPRKGIAPSS